MFFFNVLSAGFKILEIDVLSDCPAIYIYIYILYSKLFLDIYMIFTTHFASLYTYIYINIFIYLFIYSFSIYIRNEISCKRENDDINHPIWEDRFVFGRSIRKDARFFRFCQVTRVQVVGAPIYRMVDKPT